MPRKRGRRKKKKTYCKLWFCNDVVYSHGVCQKHNLTIVRYGSPISPKKQSTHNMLRMVDELATILRQIVNDNEWGMTCDCENHMHIHNEDCNFGRANDLINIVNVGSIREVMKLWKGELYEDGTIYGPGLGG